MKNPIYERKPTREQYRVNRVLRGGSWNDYAQNVGVSLRDRRAPTVTFGALGFRIVRNKS